MKVPIINHPDYVAQIGDDHRFPIKKFGELIKLLKKDGIANEQNIFEPKEVSLDTLHRAHSRYYVEKILKLKLSKDEIRKLGFPLVPSVRRRSLVATGGTVLASKLALKYSLACNTAGGSHHAFAGQGNGYCVFNDVAVAALYLKNKFNLKNILIFDLDVHQGDGTAKILEKYDDIYTVSIHSKKNYPLKKQKSNLDIEIENNIEDNEYLEIIKNALNTVNKKKFDFVFYVAGVDIHTDDRIGKMNISTEGIQKREDLVIRNFVNKKIPLCGVLGGGYNKSFDKLVLLHSFLHRACNTLITAK